MAETELELLRNGAVVRVFRLGAEPLRLGRAADNSIVLTDLDISNYHAVVSADDTGVRVRDLRSTNGTWIDGVRVTEEAGLSHGDVLQLGAECALRVRDVVERGPSPLVIVDLTAGMVHVVRDEEIHIGSDHDCTIELPGSELPIAATVRIVDGGLILSNGKERLLSLGDEFEVAGHQFRVDTRPAGPRATITEQAVLVQNYTLVATVGAAGVDAMLRGASGQYHRVSAENRATLLYVLGRQRRNDLAEGIVEEMAGWISDEDVQAAIWGRAAQRQASSNYSVLLHRVRRELEIAGFDPEFIEKRRGAIRIRLGDIEIA
jgi:hypothetical protein